MTNVLRYARWWGLGAGLLLAATDLTTLGWLGTRFDMNGQDVTWLVLAFFGSSFGLLGFLVGAMIEARRRERTAAATIQAQTETIAAARARVAASERLAALGQLAAAIAHEVRNPLAVIRSAAQSFGEIRTDDPDAERASDFIVAEIDRLANVVSTLLAFARPLTVAPRPIAVGDLFDRALMLANDTLRAKQLHIRCDATSVPLVQADADLVCQVLLGLLANAAAVVPAGGEVALAARADNGLVELAVTDSGPGVPLELRERIFEPFFTTRADGTGLGLAVAKQIVEAHGGKISVGERPEGGACFRVVLPAAA